MINVFLTIILPIFLVAGTGLVIQRWRHLPVEALSQITFYVLSPALVFQSLIDSDPPAALAFRIIAGTMLATGGITLVATMVSLVLRHPRQLRSAFILSSIFPNTGNMGLPIGFLAFGEPGLAVAVIIFVAQNILAWTLGVYVAARSSGTGLAPLGAVVRTPVLYSLIAAFILLGLGWNLPTTLARPIEMLSGAAIPSMLIVLGFQLGKGLDLQYWLSLTLAVILRLVIAALVAYGITLVLNLQGVEQQMLIVGLAMPVAVHTTIISTQFGASPKFVTSAVVISTLVGLGTLTILISLVQKLLV